MWWRRGEGGSWESEDLTTPMVDVGNTDEDVLPSSDHAGMSAGDVAGRPRDL